MDVDRIVTELKSVPHLKINRTIDVAPILNEIMQIDDYSPFSGYDQDNGTIVENALHLDVRGVVDVLEDSYSAGEHSPILIHKARMAGVERPDHIKCKPTDLG